MRMKIVHLENQPEPSLSVKRVLERKADVAYLPVASIEGIRQALQTSDIDLLLASASHFSDAENEAFAHLRANYPDIPLIVLTVPEEKTELLAETDTSVWDVVSFSDIDRLPWSVARAIETRRLQAELRQARELLRSSQKSIAVGRLLGSIAHEINNPLEAIANLLYLGQRQVSDKSEVGLSLRMAEAELQRVGDITKQMLYFHRESKSVQEVLLSEVMESILVLYQNRLGMRRIQVVRQYGSDARLLAHPGELRQAFANLIANAIDAMPQGGQLILRIRKGRRCKVWVTVADRGHGIPRDVKHRLGELLFTSKGESGTGLGLWITYQLIAKYGGTIRVYSSTRPHSAGSVFRVCFSDEGLLRATHQQSGFTEINSAQRLPQQDQRSLGESDSEDRVKTA
jgi:signal transduction histidine kinase